MNIRTLILLFLSVANVVAFTGPDANGLYKTNGTYADTQAAYNAASNGQTIQLASGTFFWDKTLVVSKQITLQGQPSGQGTQATIIVGAKVPSQFPSPAPTPGGCGTIPQTQCVADPTWNQQLIDVVSNGGADGVARGDATVANHSTLLIKDLGFVHNNVSGKVANCVEIEGTARFHYLSGNPTGGFRMTNCKFRIADPTKPTSANRMIHTNGWWSGVIDHTEVDFHDKKPIGSASQGVDLGSHGSAPGFAPNTRTPVTRNGVQFFPQLGLYSWFVPHTFGRDWAGSGSVGDDDDVIVWEDCIFEVTHFAINGQDSGTGGTFGGTRSVFRHCAFWGTVSAHGFGESGANGGTHSLEAYNNVFLHPPGNTATETGKIHDIRSGAVVAFNERVIGWPSDAVTIGAESYRVGTPGNNLIGPADGSNLFDNNHQGDLTVPGFPVYHALTNDPDGGARYLGDPTNPSKDVRIGSVYLTAVVATGNGPVGTGSFTVNAPTGVNGGGLSVGSWTGVQANQFRGFVMRVKETSCTEAQGAQCNNGNNSRYKTGNAQSSGVVTSNTAASGGVVTFNVLGAFQGNDPLFETANGDHIELRWVDDYLGAPGADAQLAQWTGGTLKNASTSGPPGFVSSVTWRGATFAPGANPLTSPAKAYPGQDSYGLWSWSNLFTNGAKYNTSTWRIPNIGFSSDDQHLISGGAHGENAGNSSSGSLAPPTSYPWDSTFPQGNTTATCRIGPDWDNGHFGGVDGNGNDLGAADGYPTSIAKGQTITVAGNTIKIGTDKAGGSPYPHPLSGVASSLPSLNGDGQLNFVRTKTPVCPPTTPAVNCYKITASNFSGTPTFSIITGTLPADVSTSSSGNTYTISGLATTATIKSYDLVVRATHVSETADLSFTISVSDPGQRPVIDTFTATGLNAPPFYTTTTINLSATAHDPDGDLDSVTFMDGATVLKTDTGIPFSYSGTFSAGSHSFTVSAVDNTGLSASPTPTPIAITVGTPPATGPTPATLSIRP